MAKAKASESTNANPKLAKTEANRIAKLNRHIKKYPSDNCAINALKNSPSTRRKPLAEHWSKRDIEAVKLYIAAGLSGKDFLTDKIKHRKALSSSGKSSNV